MGSAASTEAGSKAVAEASEGDLREFVKGLKLEDIAKLQEVMKDVKKSDAPSEVMKDVKKSDAASDMAGVYDFTNSQSVRCSVKLDASGRVEIKHWQHDDCTDAGGPDILDVTFIYGRWAQVEHDGSPVVLIATASMKKGNAMSNSSARESDIEDWKVTPLKGFLAMAAGVLALAYELDDSILPLGRGQKQASADCWMNDEADYGDASPDFSNAFPNFEVAGKYGNSRFFYLHPEGSARMESPGVDGLHVALGSWKRVHTNIVEITWTKSKDPKGDVEERSSTCVFSITDKSLQDTSTSPIFGKVQDFSGPWPAMDQF
eukprot:TRINITY_DN108551_c0_g1_i1.p1 TRINITY_DN108551_c0_g1~~TRINITY_DN108551_c0_g1_i1.p1  ORF type:complete len:318 (-),score=61.72 TRINITY_DN108551_c0_g1_i1:141-1094(-)